mmetsp:Transcript_2829/g.5250  ORF Transcript_2829/g.5250 Transcript_2829/m.5250 type:complete len:216 (+) Transcript_2829:1403-2050(+)
MAVSEGGGPRGTTSTAAARGSHGSRKRFSMVCASNQNRSMEAHAQLQARGFSVDSFGTGAQVKLPGPSLEQPNVYPFNTPYAQMHGELKQQNETLYRQNGVLAMLERNQRIKRAPERWQENHTKAFDVVITFEERVFEAVLDDFAIRVPLRFDPCFVINVETKDTHADASTGAARVVRLCAKLEGEPLLEENIESVIRTFQNEENLEVMICQQYF